MRNYSFLFVVFLGLTLVLYPEETSVLSERREILKFGTEGEILDLIKKLQEERNTSLQEEIVQLLQARISSKLTQNIFEYLRVLEVNDPRAEQTALGILETHEEQDQDLLLSVLGYLGLPSVPAHPEAVLPLLEVQRRRVVSAAVRYLGAKGTEEVARRLIERFKEEDADEEIRCSILLALGELRSPVSVDFLQSILDNPDERIVYRRYACDSLGKIAAREAYPSIRKALEDSDSLMRAYAVSAIGSYPDPEVEELLLFALRDDFARVRAFAAEKLGNRKAESAVDILIYRSRKDADRQVRTASLKALAEIGTEKAVTFLGDLLLDEKASQELRIETIRLLLTYHPEKGKVPLKTLIEREWTKDNSRLLDEACKQLSLQILSGYEEFYLRMLDHRSFIIRIYGIRGIGRNQILQEKTRIERIAKEGATAQERKEAHAVLEQWGSSP
ncbi:MAG TPA: HEAT repeat domain-containing protein [Spirochaetales bacterium]|nr:HEAT repeat domain-containing protein [Spirochaetales bacterium]